MENQNQPAPAARTGWRHKARDAESGAVDFEMYALLESYNVLGRDVWHASSQLNAAREVMPPCVFMKLVEHAAPYNKRARALRHERMPARERRRHDQLRAQLKLIPVVWIKPRASHRARPPPLTGRPTGQLSLFEAGQSMCSILPRAHLQTHVDPHASVSFP